jgi:DNA polymerase
MTSLEIDFETFSAVNIKTSGVYNYMASPTIRPLFCWYQLGGEMKFWSAEDPCPDDIIAHVTSGGLIYAHNAAFERLLWQKVLTPRYGWPEVRLEQFVCTAATAAAMSLPRDLAGLGAALGLETQKDKDGARLIRKFCLPRKARKGEDPNALHTTKPNAAPDDWQRFLAYGKRDVETEAAAVARMSALSKDDLARYYRSERINDRGIRIDVESAHAAIKLADKAKALLDREMLMATGGYVSACSQVARLTQWVKDQGVAVDKLGKADIEELLEHDDLPANVRRAIEIRQEAAKTSVAKLKSFLDRAGTDGRIRGAFLFRAAGTGRYSSTGAQLHNLPRPRKEFSDAHLNQSTLFNVIRSAAPDALRFFYGDKLGRPLHLLSDAIRGFIWAAPNHDLLVADYSGIEGAIAAWFSDESWKLAALRELITDPTLPDLYRRTAAGIYGTTTDEITKKDGRRQVGKVAELSLGYQGGVGAFHTMSRGYGLKLETVYGPVWGAADGERRERAVKRYEECLARNDTTTQKMSRDAWLAAELVKVGWRETHPAISSTWKALEEAMYAAVTTPGLVVTCLKVRYVVRRGFLWCRLPSGRCLAYGNPQVREVEVPWADKTQAPEKREKRPVVTVLGVNSVTRKWERYAMYGGLAYENCVQAIALDLLENGIEKAEDAGYPVIGHVHDEIITEVPKGSGSVEEFENLICDLPEWAAGLPLTASGWRGKRYRKD